MSTPAGWFPDPLGRYEHRYFNGSVWTADVSNGGSRLVDPHGTAPDVSTGGAFPAPVTTIGGAYGGDYGGGDYGGHEPPPRNGIAVAAMVCGIIASLIAWIPFLVVVGLILAILAVVFGIQGLKRAGAAERGRGVAIAGLVTGVVGLVLSVVGIWFTIVVWREVMAFVEAGPVSAEVTECRSDGAVVEAAGTLTNRSDKRRDYTLFVEVDGARGDRMLVGQLDDVAAGATVDWAVSDRARVAAGPCDADLSVHGPFPFGIELDPIDR